MEQTSFHPGVVSASDDAVAQSLRRVAQYILVVVCGFSPLLFIPTPFLPIGLGKTLIVMAGIVLALLFYALHLLRAGSVTLRFPLVYVAMVGVAIVAVISAVLSGDIRDALFGDVFGVQTAGFLVFITLTVGAMGVLKGEKVQCLRLYFALIASASVLALYHVARLLLGADALTFGLPVTATFSPFGEWNEIALFFGLVLLLCMLALEQLPLTKLGKVILGFVSLVGLVMLAVINFFVVWVVLASVAVIVLIYNLTKHRFTERALPLDEDQSDLGIIVLTTTVLIVSGVFIAFGPGLGGWITQMSGINYVEVRPSTTATFDVARQVYDTDPLLGIGPNKFVDAWRLHKDVGINNTVFWNTPFRQGSSFLTTAIVELGVLGAAAWLAFLSLLVFAGLRMLYTAAFTDRFWRFVGVSSFVASIYLWGMMLVYAPGPSILIVTAVCTGMFLVAYSTAFPVRGITLTASSNRNMAFVFVALVLVGMVGVLSASYLVGRQAAGVYVFNQSVTRVAPGDTLDPLTQTLALWHNRTGNDVFARQIALYKLAQMRALLQVSEPTEVERQAFQTAVADSINAATVAYESDRSDPGNSLLLAEIYGLLAGVGVEGAYGRAQDMLTVTRQLDPQNPIPLFLAAQIEAQQGQLETARAYAEEALSLRPRYTEAISLLVEIDTLEGDLDTATERIQSILSLEQDNPVRWYQLGALLVGQARTNEAVLALEQAVSLDTSYANARYLLAVQYLALEREEDALAQLEIVRTLNENNAFIGSVIEQIQTGTTTVATTTTAVSEPVAEGDVAPSGLEAQALDSDLISPVNTVPETSEETSEAAASTTESI
ncbi:MAG: hypothetical protein R3B69_01875 [Candidatus Paceibacterota bacterium]